MVSELTTNERASCYDYNRNRCSLAASPHRFRRPHILFVIYHCAKLSTLCEQIQKRCSASVKINVTGEEDTPTRKPPHRNRNPKSRLNAHTHLQSIWTVSSPTQHKHPRVITRTNYSICTTLKCINNSSAPSPGVNEIFHSTQMYSNTPSSPFFVLLAARNPTKNRRNKTRIRRTHQNKYKKRQTYGHTKVSVCLSPETQSRWVHQVNLMMRKLVCVNVIITRVSCMHTHVHEC